jgi:excisionase family DNA binding protein
MRRVGYKEAATHIGIKETTLRARVSRRQVPHYRLGGRLVVFDLDELDAWLESLRVGGTAA